MTHYTAEKAKQRNVEQMGQALGEQYSALWQEVVSLHQNWNEFVVLFGTKPERVDLLNKAAASFFRIVQDTIWESTLLHIARLTDPPQSLGRKDKANLTIQNLPALVDHPKTKAAVTQLVEDAGKQAEFCRDWRNRHIAHRDLNLALDAPAVPLAVASRKQVNDALDAISRVLGEIASHYLDTEIDYGFAVADHGATSLLYVIREGLRTQEQRRERRLRGEISRDDLPKEI